MPNANCITDRSQPPFFTRMVYGFYKKSGYKSIIEGHIGTILKNTSLGTGGCDRSRSRRCINERNFNHKSR